MLGEWDHSVGAANSQGDLWQSPVLSAGHSTVLQHLGHDIVKLSGSC